MRRVRACLKQEHGLVHVDHRASRGDLDSFVVQVADAGGCAHVLILHGLSKLQTRLEWYDSTRKCFFFGGGCPV